MIEHLFGTDVVGLALAAAAGVALGVVFFGGLWWTVERLASTRRPVRLLITSYFVRLAIALGGFILVAQGSATRVVACLAGFIAARFLVRKRLERTRESPGW